METEVFVLDLGIGRGLFGLLSGSSTPITGEDGEIDIEGISVILIDGIDGTRRGGLAAE